MSKKEQSTSPAPAPAKIAEMLTKSLSSTQTIVENYSAAIESKPAKKS